MAELSAASTELDRVMSEKIQATTDRLREIADVLLSLCEELKAEDSPILAHRQMVRQSRAALDDIDDVT